MTDSTNLMSVVILISGSGSNLQAIIDGMQAGQLPITITAVISNKADVKGLKRAEAVGITTHVIDHKAFSSREDFDRQLRVTIDQYTPQLVVLAGFMRILTADFTNHYRGRMINIHPSLLPKYQGLHTHQRAIDADDSHHGASVHFVTAELDGGPVIVQARVTIDSGDTADTLAAKVLAFEHQIFPQTIQWFAENRLSMAENGAILDGNVLGKTGFQWNES